MSFATRILDPSSNVVHGGLSGGWQTRQWMKDMKPGSTQYQPPPANPNYAAALADSQKKNPGTSLLGG